jgi:hypothetical protein
MRRVIFVLLGLLIGCIGYFESRDFICSDQGKCITDWKTYGHNRYIIPGKFYGLLKPSNSVNYVKAKYKSAGMVFIWKNGIDTLLVQMDSNNQIINNNQKGTLIIDYNSKQGDYDSLYTHFDKKQHLKLFKKNVERVAIPLEDSGAL